MRALVVDDSGVVRARVMELLREVDAIDIVEQAIDARTALESVEQAAPDLVVLDIHMPSPDGTRIDNGIEVLRLLKARANAPIVIMLSNYAEEAYRRRASQIGADAFLDKSHEFDELQTIAQSLLDARQAGRRTEAR
jgi:DNA-binding NarL/FixJ family response regulator